jgi:hypothetical protein
MVWLVADERRKRRMKGTVERPDAAVLLLLLALGGLAAHPSVRLTAATPLSTAISSVSSVLFEEKFEDPNVASRGWYDNTTLSLSTAEHIAGSTASLEYRWSAGGTVPVNGASARRQFAPTDSVYLRYWVKYSSNWVGQSQVSYGHHEFYLLTDLESAYSNLAYTHLTAYVEENKGVAQLAIQDGANVDETRIGVDLTAVTERRAVSGCNGTYPDAYATLSCYLAGPNVHWNGKQWRTTPIFDSTPGSSTYKNSWHQIEVFFRLNSILNGVGQRDGLVQYWYDGRLLFDRQDVVFRTGQNPTMRFNQFVMAPYMGDGSPVDQRFWIDDLTVATARLTPVPAPPTNVRIVR